MQGKRMPLYPQSRYDCICKPHFGGDEPGTVDPGVIKKVESAGTYLRFYERKKMTPFVDLLALRAQMGSANENLAGCEIEETPFLAPLSGRMIPVTRFRIPGRKKQKAVFFFHGGGFIGGSTGILKNQCRLLAEQSEASVFSVDYRLAPEAPFPAALEDCRGIVEWAYAHAQELSIDREKIVTAGDSAGGNLSLALALTETGEKVALVMTVYGALDLSFDEDTGYWDYGRYEMKPEHENYIYTRLNRFRDLNDTIQQLYVLNGEDVKRPDISPLYAENFQHLSKVLMIEAEYDYFRLSNDRFAEKLKKAGVPCQVIRYQGMDHGFYDRLGTAGQAEDAISEMAERVKAL